MSTHRVVEGLTPDSAALGMVREQMPLQASQKRISWSYEPVTRMTDMSARGAEDAEGLACTGMAVRMERAGAHALRR